MFSRLNTVVFKFCKNNSSGIGYGVAVASGISTYFYMSSRPENMPHHAAFFSSKLELSDCLTNTITDEKQLQETKDLMKSKMEAFITNLQGKLVKSLQELESEKSDKKFLVDRWTREEGGGGITCVIQDGEVFERGAVNVSIVHGKLPPAAIEQMRARGKSAIPSGKTLPFVACGISCVIHPRNPNVPTVHFNYRFFEVEVAPNKTEWWFGGGTDLTPYYLDEDDVKHFHKTLKVACDKNDKSFYPKYKKWCDDYFMIDHRKERRGVGGIFFDDVDQPNIDSCFDFVKSCANSVAPSYIPIVKKNMNKGYGLKERQWQLLRRGRYVEFNLIYDRGTKFGLVTPGARIESILCSMPMTASWSYKHEPEEGSEEQKLSEILKNPKEWV